MNFGRIKVFSLHSGVLFDAGSPARTDGEKLRDGSIVKAGVGRGILGQQFYLQKVSFDLEKFCDYNNYRELCLNMSPYT